jgi:hypothetical protein
MGERLQTLFLRLFEVRVLHHYWLDEGAVEFSAIADDEARTSRLLTYDVRKVLVVEPSAGTVQLIAGMQGIFRATGLGIVVAVPQRTAVDLDSTFEFHVRAAAFDYAAYTAMTLRPQTVVDVADPADGSIHRYKANVPVLSNLTGAGRGNGAAKRLFLSTEYAGSAAGDGVEALVTSGTQVRQLTGDPPGAPFHVLGARSELPVYVHQGDVPAIVPPAGSTGAPPRGVELATITRTRPSETPGVPPDVVAIIRLAPRRSDDNAFSFANANGSVRTPTRVFEMHLRNRWTTRRYRNQRGGGITSTDASPTPLTYFGNEGTDRSPRADALAVERDSNDPTRVTQLISEIYV